MPNQPRNRFGLLQPDGSADGRKHIRARVRFAEITGTSGCLRLSADLGFVARRDEDYRGAILDPRESTRTFL